MFKFQSEESVLEIVAVSWSVVGIELSCGKWKEVQGVYKRKGRLAGLSE